MYVGYFVATTYALSFTCLNESQVVGISCVLCDVQNVIELYDILYTSDPSWQPHIHSQLRL